tara:strand:- start:348 stop:1706 length:1359 start_codon:yes stop_codon:yes gene_type:complete
MNFLILDIYPNDDWRLVKDTAGGYGTGNDFGNSIFSKAVNFFVSKMISMPPMYALYIHSIMKEKGFNIDYERDVNNIELIEKADFIIMTSSIISHETEIKFLNSDLAKKKKIFVAGIFGNVFKSKYEFKNTFVIPGEPENFFLGLDNDKDKIDIFFDGSKLNFQNNFVENLDELPFPDWNYYLKKYPLKNNFLGYNRKNAIPILASRGCPYSCFNYCTYPLQQGRKVRYRSAANVVKEIKQNIEINKTNKFVFRDPVFSINRKYTVELCQEIIKENLNIEFLIETHLKNLDDELILLLKKAGLKLVYVGIESSSPDVLKGVKRFTIDNDQQHQKIKKLVEQNIVVKSMFMFGQPDDNEETIKETIDYSLSLPNQLVQYSVFTPYPGTPIYKMYEDKIIEKKYEKFNQYNLVYKHKNLENSDIIKLKNYGYQKFYSNFKNLKTVLKSFSSLLR